MRALRALGFMFVGLCIPVLQAHADEASELDDAAARLHYAFYTADVRAIEQAVGLILQLPAPPNQPGLKEYYAAYGYWKLAQTSAEEAAARRTSSRGSVSKAAQACDRQADLAVEKDPRLAEAYAIDSVCSSFGSALMLSSNCASKSLRTAKELDPQNPRILLIETLCAQKDAANPAAFTQRLRALVSAFEHAPPVRPGKPDWGQAEALVMLGENYLQRGDSLAARDAIERALVIAPDYRKAQELLQVAAARPK